MLHSLPLYILPSILWYSFEINIQYNSESDTMRDQRPELKAAISDLYHRHGEDCLVASSASSKCLVWKCGVTPL